MNNKSGELVDLSAYRELKDEPLTRDEQVLAKRAAMYWESMTGFCHERKERWTELLISE